MATIDVCPRTSKAVVSAWLMHARDRIDDLLISTDPPYYDNIGYSDLSDFFYVWLRRSLRASLARTVRDDAGAESRGVGGKPIPAQRE